MWAYDQNYVRLAAQDYNAKSTNKYVHLTNNSVVKEYARKEYGEEEDCSDDEEDLDNILSRDDFASDLQRLYKKKMPEVEDVYD